MKIYPIKEKIESNKRCKKFDFEIQLNYFWVTVQRGTALVPAFNEFFVPVVFTLFTPIVLRGKRVPPTIVIVRRLDFQSLFFTQI
jgi:hypothetical protein